jgi:hypothetical protein
MRNLVCWCPETQQPVDLQLYTDYATLARIWSNSVRFQCPQLRAASEASAALAARSASLLRFSGLIRGYYIGLSLTTCTVAAESLRSRAHVSMPASTSCRKIGFVQLFGPMAAEPMKCVDHSSAAATVGVAPWRQISPSPYRVLAHRTRASRKVS